MKGNTNKGLVFLYFSTLIILCSLYQSAPINEPEACFQKTPFIDSLPKDNTFAKRNIINQSVEQFGTWKKLENNLLSWNQTFNSSGSSVNFSFSKFYLPASATVEFRDLSSDKLLLKLNAKANKANNKYWTPILRSRSVSISIEIKEEHREKLLVHFDAINVGLQLFNNPTTAIDQCMIDVICGTENGFPEIEENRDIIQSVGMTTIGGVRICSGVLINNTSNDRTPYFLSARHCGIDVTNVESVVVHWNFENSTCRFGEDNNDKEGDGSLATFNSGASIVAEYRESDMVLMLLDEPVNPQANAFFAGWDARSTIPEGGTIIHHASSMEKRISFDSDLMDITRHFGEESDLENDHIRVFNYEQGSTAQGSSGGPLFNQSKRVVGQLHGGRASCEESDSDWYGRFFTSWLGDGLIERQLKHWLDPIESNAEFIDGIWDQPQVELQVTVIQIQDIQCFGDANAAIEINVQGGQGPYQFSIDNGQMFSTQTQFENLNAGEYTILVRDANGNLSASLIYTIDDAFEMEVTAQVLYNQVNLKVVGGQEPYLYSLNGVDFFDAPIFRQLESGRYTFMVLDANDCIATYELELMVTPFAVELFVFQDLDCFSDSTGILEVNVFEGGLGPFTYSLDSVNYQDSPTFENIGPGTYVAYIQDFIGNEYVTDTVEIGTDINPIEIEIEQFENFITVSAMGGQGMLTYSLDGINFTSMNVFEDLPSGTFQVFVKDENGCIAVSESITITSINNLDFESNINLYPTPSKGDLTVQFPGETNKVILSIYSINGLKVHEKAFDGSNKLILNLSRLDSGIYLAKVADKQGVISHTRPFVINK